MDIRSIAWVVPYASFDIEPIARELRDFGFHVIPCSPGGATQMTTDLRVLPADAFREPHELRSEYNAKTTPTMILASSAAQAFAACEFVGEADDVAQSGEAIELLAWRLTRLAKRAMSFELSRVMQNLDPLTGLLNHKGFKEEVGKYLEDHLPVEATGLVYLDLDNFKRINDLLGHPTGDMVLREVAALLQREASPTDRFGRSGGDEFSCLLARYDEHTVAADAMRILERIRDFEFSFEPRTEISASAGLVFLQSPNSLEEAFRQADAAMYEAKSSGRNRLVVFERPREAATEREEDLYLRHFENVTRLITERVSGQITNMARRLAEAARREANEDPLTGLKNRRYFEARIAREIEVARKGGRALTIALMDLDDFGAINKAFRWPTGDRVLQHFSEIARDNIRLVDWLARYGGEAFSLVMPDTDLQMGCSVAERVRSQLESSTVDSVDKGAISVTVSIGVAQLTDDIDGATALVDQAAKALTDAKQSGKNRIVPVPFW